MTASTPAPSPSVAPAATATAPSAKSTPATMPRCLQVQIGKLEVGERSDQLHALLGSCVGIAFLWKKRGCCGLASQRFA